MLRTYMSGFRLCHRISSYVAPLPMVNACSIRCFSRFTPEEEETFRKIESWFGTFKKQDIPVDTFDKAFSRSSGPGGQNVNKLNTKAELRFPLNSAHWLLDNVRVRLRNSFPRYITQDGYFVITAEEHRTQKQNFDACVNKLYACIKEACQVPKATSQEQKERIRKLANASNQKRLFDKQKQKEKKSNRSSNYGRDY